MCMTPHGPDAATFERAITCNTDTPEHLSRDTLAFMFEVNDSAQLVYSIWI